MTGKEERDCQRQGLGDNLHGTQTGGEGHLEEMCGAFVKVASESGCFGQMIKKCP